jgi:hypothetical protein
MRTVDETQFEFGLDEIVHKPTGAHFRYRSGSLIFDNVHWTNDGPMIGGFNKCEVWSAAQALLRGQFALNATAA